MSAEITVVSGQRRRAIEFVGERSSCADGHPVEKDGVEAQEVPGNLSKNEALE